MTDREKFIERWRVVVPWMNFRYEEGPAGAVVQIRENREPVDCVEMFTSRDPDTVWAEAEEYMAKRFGEPPQKDANG